MNTNHIFGVLLIIAGLYSVLRFKHEGRSIIETQKKVNKLLRLGPEEKYFGKHAVISQQIVTLIIGIIFIIGGISLLFQSL